MRRKQTAGDRAAEDIQIMKNLNAGYEGALADVKVLLSVPGFDLARWIDARLSLSKDQL